jgi:16S rRNA (guanine527-N7)-methyltransferase
MMKELAVQAKAICGLQLTKKQIEALETYEKELLIWNARFNLTAITDPGKIKVKHFLDSLTCMCVMRDTNMDRVIDIGTGAGFPGIPLKIINPAMHLTLVDSVGKKTQFCDHIIQKLAIDGVDIFQERAEVIGQKPEFRQAVDWALARAVAVLPVLAEFLLPLVKLEEQCSQ